MEINGSWSDIKAFITTRNVSLQWIQSNSNYYLFAADGPMSMTSLILTDGSASADQTDFETNYKSSANQPLIPSLTTVTTQFENNNKDLKIASFSAELPNDGVTTSTTASILIPGTFGSGDGRFVLGGYGLTEDYNKDDKAILYVTDPNRCIAWMLALAMNPSATEPLPDATVQAMGVLPMPLGIALPSYPVVKNYYDDSVPSGNQGWYFWPLAIANSVAAIGEIELNPIAGYAFIPSGLMLNIKYNRPAGVFNGGIRINLDWGKSGIPGTI
jgi:hypothetical protein